MSTPKYTFIARTFSLCSGGWVHTRLEFQITLIEIARIGRVVVRENFRRASMTEACSSARLGRQRKVDGQCLDVAVEDSSQEGAALRAVMALDSLKRPARTMHSFTFRAAMRRFFKAQPQPQQKQRKRPKRISTS